MDKLLIEVLAPTKVNGKTRKMCIVACPDCFAQRQVRCDSFKVLETTCCRTCTNLRRPTKPEEELFNWKEFYHSKEGKLAHMYQQHKQRSSKKGWPQPTYTQEELFAWGMALPHYHSLFNTWVSSGYARELSPSIDRLDDYLPYSLDNIRMVAWEENNHKGSYWQVIGKNTKNCLAVDQLTLDGQFIQRFHSCMAASRALNIDDSKIGIVCRGLPIKKGNRYSTPQTAGGYRWRFSTHPNPPVN